LSAAVNNTPHRQLPADTNTQPFRIAIIGGGFSSLALLIQLAKHAANNPKLHLHITVIEPAEQLGRGIAYAVNRQDLLLNVRSDRLTADASTPGDFHTWLSAETPATPTPPQPDFYPRWRFGSYARARLDQALDAAKHNFRLEHVRAAATSLTHNNNKHNPATSTAPSTITITTTNPDGSAGPTVTADHAVLALGLGPTRTPNPLNPLTQQTSHQLLVSPWDQHAMQALAERPGTILLVGTGLTMCDAAITLKNLNTKARLIAISRRGLTPRVHDHADPTSHTKWAETLPGSDFQSVVRALRARATPDNWRSVIDSLRPHTAGIWAAFNTSARARFIRHAAAYWDVHRHRMPPQVARAIEQLKQQDQLRILRARLENARPDPTDPSSAIVRLREHTHGKNETTTELKVTGVVLCTGPDSNPARWNSPLVDSILKANLAAIDPLGLGFHTTSEGFLLNDANQPTPLLSTLGPLRRSDLWESIAAPEIVAQAQTLANAISTNLMKSINTD